LADVVQVIVNRRDHGDRFAVDDRARDRAVLLARPLDDRRYFASVVAGIQQLVELGRAEQRVEHLAVQLGQELVAARRRDQPVEAPIELTEVVELHRWRELLRHLRELTALCRRRPTGGKFGHLYFDDPSRLEEIAHHHLARVDHRRDFGEVLDDVGTIAAPFELSGLELRTSASIGISLSPLHGVTNDELLKAADAAMYRAKQEGGHSYQFFSRDLTRQAMEHYGRFAELWAGADAVLQPQVAEVKKRLERLRAQVG